MKGKLSHGTPFEAHGQNWHFVSLLSVCFILVYFRKMFFFGSFLSFYFWGAVSHNMGTFLQASKKAIL